MTAAPTTELGTVDTLPGWGALVPGTNEANEPAAWLGPQRVVTVNRMRVDAQVDSLCNSVTMPVLRLEWRINPNGARDEVVEQISTDLGIPVAGTTATVPRSRRRFNHREHLEHALLALWYGHMFFAQVPDTEKYDLATDGWRLRKLSPRMPGSIQTIHVAKDGGLVGISQHGYRPPPRARQGLSLLGDAAPQIPVSSLAAYIWKREGANWYGRSMLRPLYRDWVLKDRSLRTEAMKNERFGLGIPTATAPPGGDPNEYARLAQTMRGTEYAGVGLPAGASVGVEGIRGTLPDILAFIRYCDESMARTFMAMVVQLGQTQTGSRALGETFADFFKMLVEAVANWYRDTTNEHVVEDMVDWNWGEDEPAPLLEWSYPQGEEEDLAIADLVSMVESGVITMDTETERLVRQRTRLPELPPDFERPEPAAVEAASVTVRKGVRKGTPKITVATNGRSFAARKQTVGDTAIGHREPNDIELAAGTDFVEIQETWQDATTDLVGSWRTEVQAAQIDALVDQVREAVDAGNLVGLAQLEAPVLGTDLLTARMVELAEDAVVGAKAEAAAQGVAIGTVNVAEKVTPVVAARAEATANLLARGIADSASRAAINLGAELAADEVAEAVREHLAGLTDAYLEDMLGGAMTQAQNAGRKAVFDEQPSTIYASELLDMNTCSECASVDGKRFDGLVDADQEYPTGGYRHCAGGPRCRGTLIAIYDEAND